MSHLTRLLERLVWLGLMIAASAVFMASSLSAEEEKKAPEKKTPERKTIRLRVPALRLLPVVSGNTKAAAKQGEGGQDASKDSKADAEKKRKQAAEAMQKALEQAQKAYEEEKREQQERLANDPLWQASHTPTTVIAVSEKSAPTTVNTFCLNGEGNLLVGCGATRYEYGADEKTGLAVQKKIEDAREIRIYRPDGQKLGTWKIETQPQAMCLGADGMVFVGGTGKLIKFDKDGKVLKTGDLPSVAELPLPPPPEKKVEDEAAQKAKVEKIAELKKQSAELLKEYQKAAEEARKDLKANDQESTDAYQAKIKEPLDKYAAASRELSELQMTPELRYQQAMMNRDYSLTITGVAVAGNDLFVASVSPKGSGFMVWRTDLDFGNAKKIIENLAGCCGQMDIQVKNGDLWVAHNARHKVERYDRDGKKLAAFGKNDRISAEGFGGCCEPKNLRFGPEDVLYAAESGPPTCVKRFSTDGKFLNVAVVAPWNSGCVRVTTEVSGDGNRIFLLNTGDNSIQVFAKKGESEAKTTTTEN